MEPKDKFNPRRLVVDFDEFLFDRGVNLEAVIIGSSAMAFLNLIHQYTVDVDVLKPHLSDRILKLSTLFRQQLQKQKGIQIAHDWLNNGP